MCVVVGERSGTSGISASSTTISGEKTMAFRWRLSETELPRDLATGGRAPGSCSCTDTCGRGNSSTDSSGRASRPRTGESASGDGGQLIFSKVSLTIGVCGNAFRSAWGEILSLALSCSWPSHITTVGLISSERAEYRLARELGRESWEPLVDGLETAKDGVEGVTPGVVFRLRGDKFPL